MVSDEEIEKIKYLEDYEIPVLPNIMVEAFNAIKNPSLAMGLLAKILQQDETISSKVLGIVNTSYYGNRGNIPNLSKAILTLGVMKIKNLIMCLSLKNMMSENGSRALWEHSVKCAIAAEIVAKEYNVINPDDAYAMGFLHDIGKMALNMEDSVKYSKVDYLVNRRNINIINAEEAQFGINHCALGEMIIKKRQMPIILSNCVKYHHDPLRASLPSVCAILYIADRLIQNNIQAPFFEKEVMDKLSFTISDPITLRETTLAKANLFLKELLALY